MDYQYDPLLELAGGKAHPLIEVCKDGDTVTLSKLLEEYRAADKPVRMCDIQGCQAVHRAAEREDTACLEMLLKYDDCLVHENTKDNTTPLILAAGLGNIKAVDVILPLLSSDEIAHYNIHGLNALYYSVKKNSVEGTSIALRLMEKNSDLSHLAPKECSYECIPYSVVKHKNMAVLKALVDAGLSVDYDYYQLAVGFRDSDLDEMLGDHTYPGMIQPLFPGCLLGYCVKYRWTEGLRFLLASHKQRIAMYKPDSPLAPTSFGRLLNYEPRPGTHSPLALACLLGLSECLDLMLETGLTVKDNGYGSYIKPCRENTRTRGPPLTYNIFPLSMSVFARLFEKKDFIRHMLGLQSINEFEVVCEDYLLAYVSNPNREVAYDMSCFLEFSNPSYRKFHPLDAVASMLAFYFLRKRQLSPLRDGVDMLLDCGFTFDFRRICIESQYTLCHHNTISRLLYHSQQVETRFFLLIELLNRSLNLELTADALTLSCETLGHGIHMAKMFGPGGSSSIGELKIKAEDMTENVLSAYKYPHLLITKEISKRSAREIEDIYDDAYIARNTVCYKLRPVIPGEWYKTAAGNVHKYCKPSKECWWFPIAQLIIKGIRIKYSHEDIMKWKLLKRSFQRPKTVCYPRIPYSLVVYPDDEFRRKFINAVLLAAENLLPQEKTWLNEPVSSLQSKCRYVIRQQIGTRLLLEPVPRDDLDLDLSSNQEWEKSSIDQLPIPKLFRGFLRFQPEMMMYDEYYKACKTDRHWI